MRGQSLAEMSASVFWQQITAHTKTKHNFGSNIPAKYHRNCLTIVCSPRGEKTLENRFCFTNFLSVVLFLSVCVHDDQLLRACVNAKMAVHTYTQLATNAALASSSSATAAASVEPPTPIESVVATLQVRCFR